EQLHTESGQSNLARRTVQQAHADLRFQLLDGGGHGRARPTQPVDRLDATAHLRHLREDAILLESVHALRLCAAGPMRASFRRYLLRHSSHAAATGMPNSTA